MIWLASFPRSGNTFFRNVLYEVYGLASSTYHKDATRKLDDNFLEFPVIKTHLLPSELPEQPNRKMVYLLRDGRDSMVSIAHHRKDIVQKGTDFYNNLLEAILAQFGSYFGGWSENVRQWAEVADIVIRFEDLIADPLREVEKLRAIMDLPEPNIDKLPTFKQLKFGKPKYGGGKKNELELERVRHHFRRGKAGGWRDELPPELEALFWQQHGAQMERFGYQRDLSPYPKDAALRATDQNKHSVLLEVSKLFTNDNDGIKRYLLELVEHLPVILEHYPNWTVDLYFNDRIQPLHTIHEALEERGLSRFDEPNKVEATRVALAEAGGFEYENTLLRIKAGIKRNLPSAVYETLAYPYRHGPFRYILRKLHERKQEQIITVVEKEYERELNSYDIIHVPLPQHMYKINQLEGQVLVTMHDFTHRLFSNFHTQDNILKSEQGMKTAIERNSTAICISKATQQDLIRLYDWPESKTHLLYEAASRGKFLPSRKEEDFSPIREKYGLPDKPFLLCLSTIEPRKNLLNTLKAFLALRKEHPSLDIALVICGKKGWKFEEVFNYKLKEEDHIYFTGFVEDLDLPLFYAHAKALCYVSFYEGFGLPPLEAMSCGTPVIYGDNSSMPEVVSDAGLAVAVDDVEAIAEKMYQIVSDEELWEEFATKALARSYKFSWLKAAVETLEVYKKMVQAQG